MIVIRGNFPSLKCEKEYPLLSLVIKTNQNAKSWFILTNNNVHGPDVCSMAMIWLSRFHESALMLEVAQINLYLYNPYQASVSCPFSSIDSSINASVLMLGVAIAYVQISHKKSKISISDRTTKKKKPWSMLHMSKFVPWILMLSSSISCCRKLGLFWGLAVCTGYGLTKARLWQPITVANLLLEGA